MALIRAAAPAPDPPIIDVGGGASTLVDDLLAEGYTDLTVLDVSPAALDLARARLGARASSVTWLARDVTDGTLPDAHFHVWHDRAVFHFLIDPADRARYIAQVRRAVAPGGHVVVGTFGPEGPHRCSACRPGATTPPRCVRSSAKNSRSLIDARSTTVHRAATTSNSCTASDDAARPPVGRPEG